MSDEQAAAAQYDDDEIPFTVEEEVNPDEIGDLSDQRSSADAIEPVKGVLFEVKKASLDTRMGDLLKKDTISDDYAPGPPFLEKSLRIQAAITDAGIDGEGRYAGKVFFPDFRLVLNFEAIESQRKREIENGEKKKPYNDAWWRKEAREDTKLFMLAVGKAEIDGGVWKMTSPINDEFLASLIGARFTADVIKEKDGLRQGEFRNRLARFRRAEATATDEVEAE